MNERKVMQQALEALEESVDLVRHEYTNNWRHEIPSRAGQLESLRQGVEAHEAAIVALRTALAEPQPEPVAWCNASAFEAIQNGAESCIAIRHKSLGFSLPLYAVPPQRLPLTDAQLASACVSYRHDFGLLSEEERKRIMFQAREWERAINKEYE